MTQDLQGLGAAQGKINFNPALKSQTGCWHHAGSTLCPLFALHILFLSLHIHFSCFYLLFSWDNISLSYIDGVGKFKNWFAPLHSPQQMVESCPDASLFVLQVINPPLTLPVPPVIPI